MYTSSVDIAWNLYASIRRKVIDVTVVKNISTDLVRCVCNNSLHDIRSILFTSLMADLAILEDILALFFPALDLFDTSSRIFVKRNIELLDHLRIFGFNEERIILCIVLTGLCAVVSKMTDVLVTYHILMLLAGGILLLGDSADLRVQVVSVFVMDLKKPCHVVDTCDQLGTSLKLVFHSHSLKKFLGADLNAVAETYGADLCETLHIAGEHCHRVGVVQEQSVRADLFHIPCELFQNRNGTKCTHDTTNSQGICDSLFDAVFLRDLKVCYCTWLIAAYLNGIDYEVCITKCIFTVLSTEICFDHCAILIYVVVDGT